MNQIVIVTSGSPLHSSLSSPCRLTPVFITNDAIPILSGVKDDYMGRRSESGKDETLCYAVIPREAFKGYDGR